MVKRIDELPTVLTSFAYGDDYFAEMEGMIETARDHHPNWSIVVGRGPVPGYELPTFEVESPAGRHHWSLPVPLNLENRRGSDTDFDKICFMVGWWVARVWREFGQFAGDNLRRVVYSDVDNRFNDAMDIELDPASEVIASPWWHETEYFDGKGMLSTCLALFQGSKGGEVEQLIDQWSGKCIESLLRNSKTMPPVVLSDEELLTEVLHNRAGSEAHRLLLKLDRHKYACWPIEGLTPDETTESIADRKLIRRGLVDQWHFTARTKLPEGSDVHWPPPEEFRRLAPIGTPLRW